MRPLLQFVGFCFIVFFIVGEFQGWYLGLPPQTPMYLYKMDKTVNITRDTHFNDALDLNMRGRVRRGNVTVEVYFEVPPSFQANSAGIAPKLIFSEAFYVGQTVSIFDTLDEGKGRYTLRIHYQDATGSFTLKLPSENQL